MLKLCRWCREKRPCVFGTDGNGAVVEVTPPCPCEARHARGLCAKCPNKVEGTKRKCVECKKKVKAEGNRQWYLEGGKAKQYRYVRQNKEKRRATQRAWAKRNPEKVKEARRKYYRNNPEPDRAKSLRYYYRHRDERRAYLKAKYWREREQRLADNREYRAAMKRAKESIAGPIGRKAAA